MSAQHKTVIMIVVVLLAILVEALGQAPCGCAPQPTIIQLSCNGRGSGSVAPHQPAPVSPAPAPATDFNVNQTSSHVEEVTPSQMEEEVTTVDYSDWVFDEGWCNRDASGRPTGSLVGGWPAGYRWTQACRSTNICSCGPPEVYLDDPDQPRPAANWNGDLGTLGFDIGNPGTPTYNMIMCWPVHVWSHCEEWGTWIRNHREMQARI